MKEDKFNFLHKVYVFNFYAYLLYSYIIGFLLSFFNIGTYEFSVKSLFEVAVALLGITAVIYTILNPLFNQLLKNNYELFNCYVDSVKDNQNPYDEHKYSKITTRIKNNRTIYNITLIYFLASLITFTFACVMLFLSISSNIKRGFLLGNILIQLMFFYLSIILLFKLSWKSNKKLQKLINETQTELTQLPSGGQQSTATNVSQPSSSSGGQQTTGTNIPTLNQTNNQPATMLIQDEQNKGENNNG